MTQYVWEQLPWESQQCRPELVCCVLTLAEDDSLRVNDDRTLSPPVASRYVLRWRRRTDDRRWDLALDDDRCTACGAPFD